MVKKNKNGKQKWQESLRAHRGNVAYLEGRRKTDYAEGYKPSPPPPKPTLPKLKFMEESDDSEKLEASKDAGIKHEADHCR